MSYRDSSNQSGDLSEHIVYADLIKKGWVICTPSSRDAVYDLVVDLGGRFVKVQVKTMYGNSITKVVDRSGERVSKNGKTRNSLDYAKHDIDWLVGVNKEGETFYYNLENYSKIPSKSFSVNKWQPDNFPTNEVSTRHKTKKGDNV